jgi:hypothetical protein
MQHRDGGMENAASMASSGAAASSAPTAIYRVTAAAPVNCVAAANTFEFTVGIDASGTRCA